MPPMDKFGLLFWTLVPITGLLMALWLIHAVLDYGFCTAYAVVVTAALGALLLSRVK